MTNAFFTLLGVGILMSVYLIPSWIAILRHHNESGVIIVNVLLGWTFFGWVIALVMACGNRGKP